MVNCLDILRAMGITPGGCNFNANTHQFWLFCCNKNWQILNECTKMVIRLYWRIAYKHITQVTTNKTPFNIQNRAVKDLNRQVMERILAYKVTRNRFFQKRRLGILQHHLPEKAAKAVKQLGELSLITGKLKLKASLKQHLASMGAFNDYE